jgi:hypothetical protein
MIGIVDEPKQKNQRYWFNSKNAVCYYGDNGYKYRLTFFQVYFLFFIIHFNDYLQGL